MNQTKKHTTGKKLLALLLALIMAVSLLPMSVFAADLDAEDQQAVVDQAEPADNGQEEDTAVPEEPVEEDPAPVEEPVEDAEDGIATFSTAAVEGYDYSIVHVDCGRKYFSVDSINSIIDNAAAAGMHYVQLAIGNDGLRFLLNDMSLTVNGTKYTSEQVSDAIHKGNEAYYDFDVDELTEKDMLAIMQHANDMGVQIIPLINTPGHMDAILSAATSLTGKTCSYNGSARTIDVTNSTAVAFTQALLQKYINYFAGKGCQLFNMGADEYANDKFENYSGMGFGKLQDTGKYGYYVTYVNEVAKMIENAGMTPMAFNDGIYFRSDTSSGTFDKNILICYWSNGWGSYTPMPAADLASMGFKMINAHGDYYWVLGKSDWQCDATKASGFNRTAFQGGTIDNPVGAMFLIWCDYPGAGTEASVISSTAATIAAFGDTLPTTEVPSQHVNLVEGSSGTETDATVKDTTSNVAVTAPGLKSVTVEKVTDSSKIPTVTNAAEGKVVAYDVKPATADGSYTGEATVSFPIPSGWDTSKVRGFVVNSDKTVTDNLTGNVVDGAKFEFTAPHFSVMGIYEVSATAALNTEKITLTVGGTATRTVSGEATDGEHTTNPTGFATAKVETVDVPGGKIYELADVAAGTFYVSTSPTDSSPAAQVTIESVSGDQYNIKYNSQYIYPNATYNWGWSYKLGSRSSSNNNTVVTITGSSTDGYVISREVSGRTNYGTTTTTYLTLSGTSFGASGTDSTLYLYTEKDAPATTQQTITFTGVKAGETTVQIGDTLYTITVTAENLDNVTPLTVEYWITNSTVYIGTSTTISKQIKATDTDVYGEAGTLFSGLVPENGTSTKSGKGVIFWKGTRLTSNNKQTDAAGIDKTKAGNDFTYIRYWNQKWSFSADRVNWTDFNSNDQVVAYYLQKTAVTDEVTTNVVDWGEVPHTGYNSDKFVLLDYAVKYESGTLSPDSFSVSGKTQGFHCNYGSTSDLGTTVIKESDGVYYRKIGAIFAQETADYEVYMITLTPNDDGKTTSTQVASNCNVATKYEYNGTEKVVWVDDVANLGDFADESKHYVSPSGDIKFTVGGDPVVPGIEIYNRHAMLVTYYVRAKATDTSLTVRYWERKANGDETKFYEYNIAVKDGTFFNENIKLPETTIDGKTALTNGKVINNTNKPQYVSSDLKTMPSISAQYRYSDYVCVEVRRSEDGKTVDLYYTFNSTKTFVVDFGLPTVIRPTDLNSNLGGTGVRLTAVDIVQTTTFATIAKNNDLSVTYTLKKMIDDTDNFGVAYTGTIPKYDENGNQTGTQSGTVEYSITVIPASTVYYEDSFASFTAGKGAASGAVWSDDTDGSKTSANQLLEVLGEKTNLYGYDAAYADCTMFSMGSAKKVTVTADMVTNWNDATSAWPTATFTFKGTGFDVISLTDNRSGAIFVDVYKGKDTTGTRVKSHIVDNYYGYKQVDGKWVVDETSEDCLYQIPVMKITGLDYGEYTAVITAFYDGAFDHTQAGNSYSFWLDAIRVYDPMDKDYADYTKDQEGYPQYIKLRDALADEKNTNVTSDAVFIDGADQAAVSLYKNYGPNNEVYLAQGQAITFKVPTNAQIDTVQIGAKSPDGKVSSMTVNDVAVPIAGSATEMYYKLDNVGSGATVTIANATDGILSLTNLKITFKSQQGTVTLAALSDEEQANAVAAVRALFAAPEPDPEPVVFAPEYFQATWNRSTVKVGQKATLTVKTSADVETVTVNGQDIGNYRVRTERTGWGWNAKKVTYHVFTFTVTAAEAGTLDYSVVAANAEGVNSEAITAALTVQAAAQRPGFGGWLGKLFGRWF